jgi:hypothetical protein
MRVYDGEFVGAGDTNHVFVVEIVGKEIAQGVEAGKTTVVINALVKKLHGSEAYIGEKRVGFGLGNRRA